MVAGKAFKYAVSAGHTRSPMGAVLKSIENRRSIRKFRPDSVDDEKIKAILSAGRWAPSFLNLQPWKFIVVKDKGIKKQIGEALRLPFLVTDYLAQRHMTSLRMCPRS
jgi:nitroreductase